MKVSFSKKKSSKISLNKTALKLVKGKKYKLKLKNVKTSKVKWRSRNKKIASVNKSGKVTAKRKGSTTITASYGKKKYKCRVTVVDKKTTDDSNAKEESSEKTDNNGNTEQTSSTTEQAKDNNTSTEKQETDNNSTTEDIIKEDKTMVLLINDTEIEVLWEDNESVKELEKMAEDKDISIAMSGYGGFEQVGSIGTSITRNDVQMTTSSGDIVLYSGSNIVIFYGSNRWNYTKLGKVINKTDEELKELLSGSDIVMTIKLKF